jgi:O-acetyl-ADP-ribose deacetylase (regulator of RNase III)
VEEVKRQYIKDNWAKEEALTIEQRRHRYANANFVTIKEVAPWTIQQISAGLITYSSLPESLKGHMKSSTEILADQLNNLKVEKPETPKETDYKPDPELNRKVCTWRGNITTLEIDAIVNAANRSMLGGGGVDGAIHDAAGHQLYLECKRHNGCATGDAKITRGYALPAKFVIHTVGPIGEIPDKLESYYKRCLDIVAQHNVRTIAFCGVSTGVYGYPLYAASRIALKTTRAWLDTDDNRNKVDRIIFCTFLPREETCYTELLAEYFPVVQDNEYVAQYDKEMKEFATELEQLNKIRADLDKRDPKSFREQQYYSSSDDDSDSYSDDD